VETLPAATIPGAAQTPPVQENRRPGVPWRPQSRRRREHAAGRALPGTTSRYVENRTTHRTDFKHGGSDKVYLKKIAAVENHDVVANAGTTFAYVPGIVGGNVAILNTATRTLVSAITSGTTNAYGVAATPDGSQVWVTESGTNTVCVIPTQGSAPNKIAATIVVGIYPHGIAITPDGKTAYVANTGPNTGPGGSETVSVIDVSTQTVTATIDVGEAPQVVTISPDGSQVFVTCADGVYVITAASGSVSKVRERLRNPHGMSVTPDGAHAYVTDTDHDAMVAISTSSLRSVGRIAVGRTPWNTAFSADGSSAYVSNANDNTVSVIDTASRTVTTTIALGSGTTADTEATFTQINQVPTAVSLSPDGTIWVACNASSHRSGQQRGDHVDRHRARRRANGDRLRVAVAKGSPARGRPASAFGAIVDTSRCADQRGAVDRRRPLAARARSRLVAGVVGIWADSKRRLRQPRPRGR
jgi:phospholipase C